MTNVQRLLPDDYKQLCDRDMNNWPDGWFETFGKKAFFYVSGFGVYLARQYGPLDDSGIETALKALRVDVPRNVKDTWVKDLYPTSRQDFDINGVRKDLHLNNFTEKNLKDSYMGTPVTFSTALLSSALVALELNSRKPKRTANIQGIVDIRLACFHLVGFELIYPSLTDEEKIKLQNNTRHFKPTTRNVFPHLAAGWPVTYRLAKKISEEVSKLKDRNGNNRPLLSIQPYTKLTDIPRNGIIEKRLNEETRRYEDHERLTRQPAGPEELDL